MKYMNHKKSRVTDLFRKMDKNNEGFIPREDFIDGIMKTSKFSACKNDLRTECPSICSFISRHRIPHQPYGDECCGQHV